jgi:integrase
MAKRYLPPNTFAGWGRAKENMNKVVDIEPWTLHDLRRTFATMHAEIGTPIHVTEKLLNHSSGTLSGVAGIYNRHTYLEEMRAAVTNYDAHLTHLLNS